jgi:hypothetical protein
MIALKVYGALEEPDYVAGVAAIRREEPSLEEMIHQHTVMGNFQVTCLAFFARFVRSTCLHEIARSLPIEATFEI